MRVRIVVFCALAGPLLVATPALAVRGHVFSHTFSTSGSGNGQLNEPEDVAVNEATGDVYVVDKVDWCLYRAVQWRRGVDRQVLESHEYRGGQ
jgi:hypothetical protein